MSDSSSTELVFEQLLYSWSEVSVFGRRGFGVVAASPGWLSLLNGSDDLLGPVVAYPEPGRRGALPPEHGGLAVLRGTPVLFRRLPSGSDALDRPGNYKVHALIGCDAPISTQLAAGLLTSDWLTSALPETGPKLPQLQLPKPSPRRNGSGASALVCGAVLQGLRDQRRVVIAASTESAGRTPLCDALRRLPKGLADGLTFSTLESEPDRSSFAVAVAVAGWETSAPPRAELRVDLDSGSDNLDAAALRWGRELAEATAASLRGIPEPVTVAALGTRLDGLAILREDPLQLTAVQLLSVLTSPEGQTWATEPLATEVTRSVVAGMDAGLGPQFARAAARRPAVSSLLERVGWDVVSGRSGVSTRKAAEALLLGLGAPQGDIDMAVLSAEPERALPPQESVRLLRLLDHRGKSLSKAAASKVTWDPDLAQSFPRLWFEAVVLARRYDGPPANSAVVEVLTPQDVGEVLGRAHKAGQDADLARRLWAVLPSARRDQVDYLRLLGASGEVGLGVMSEQLLGQPSLPEPVRREVLASFWPILVRELQLPPYLAEAMRPAGEMSDAAKAGVGLIALTLLAAIIWGIYLLR